MSYDCALLTCHAAVVWPYASQLPPHCTVSIPRTLPTFTSSIRHVISCDRSTVSLCIVEMAHHWSWSATGEPQHRPGQRSRSPAVCVGLGHWRRSTPRCAAEPVAEQSLPAPPSSKPVAEGLSGCENCYCTPILGRSLRWRAKLDSR